MTTLIVQERLALGQLWARHIVRMGQDAEIATSLDEAIRCIFERNYDAIVLDLVMTSGSALSIADVAQLQQPQANLIFVTDTTFFSDGSIFQHVANVRAMLETDTPPEDLAAIVHHYAQEAGGAGDVSR